MEWICCRVAVWSRIGYGRHCVLIDGRLCNWRFCIRGDVEKWALGGSVVETSLFLVLSSVSMGSRLLWLCLCDDGWRLWGRDCVPFAPRFNKGLTRMLHVPRYASWGATQFLKSLLNFMDGGVKAGALVSFSTTLMFSSGGWSCGDCAQRMDAYESFWSNCWSDC